MFGFLTILKMVVVIALIALVLWSFIKLFIQFWKIALIVYGISIVFALLTFGIPKLF